LELIIDGDIFHDLKEQIMVPEAGLEPAQSRALRLKARLKCFTGRVLILSALPAFTYIIVSPLLNRHVLYSIQDFRNKGGNDKMI
jgi:hypothetical protein